MADRTAAPSASVVAARTVAPGPVALQPFARGPVLVATAALALVLSVTSAGYGYHRDELYFRMLDPAWGYLDQPPLAPFLARTLSTLVADEPWALRVPATLSAAALVVVLVLVTRELGGDRRAQTLCAWAAASASVPLVMGHVLLTASLDLPVWPTVVLLAIRAQLRGEPRWWLAAGLLAGLSTWNKLLVAVLLLSIVAGLLAVGPRRALWSRWTLGGAALLLVAASPNLAHQALHGWPQLTMGSALAEENAGEVRLLLVPFLVLLLGPPLVPVWVAGLTGLWRRPDWRPVRFVAAAFPVLVVLVWLMGAQVHYPLGLVAVLLAAGCVPVAERLARTGGSWHGLVATNAAFSAAIALPLLPVTVLGSTPVPAVNQVARDSVGWPVYVRQVAAAVDALPPEQRERVALVATNYGEAGALDRFGPEHELPEVHSGHNALADRPGPPADATVAVVVGWQAERVPSLFRSCETVGRLDNGVGVDNEEQGAPIAVCHDPVGGWAEVWPRLRHQG